MNYGKILLKHVCEITSLCENSEEREKLYKAYKKSAPTPNFAEGYAERYFAATEKNSYLGLAEILKVFYNDTFKYCESNYCEGYGLLIEYLEKIPYENVNDLIEELDEVSNMDAFRDEEGYFVSDDNEIRRLRNVRDCFWAYEDMYEGNENDKITDMRVYERRIYDTPEALTYVENSYAADKEDVAEEWKLLHA